MRVSVRLVDVVVKVYDELGSPLNSEINLVRGGRLAGRSMGSEARFDRVPAGAYTLRVTYGPKQVEQTVRVDSETNEFRVTMPVALTFLGGYLSLSDLYTVVGPLIDVGVVIGSLMVFSKLRHRIGSLIKHEGERERRRGGLRR